MKRLLTLLLLGLCLTVSADRALIPDMKFRRLDTQNGLSSSQVNCVFKDSRGYVWIGTPYGLNRFDGYRIRTFYSNMRDTTSMRDNYTDRIYEAYDGKLWMRQGMNYCVYDPVTETFDRDASRVLGGLGLKCSIEQLYIDSKKNFWVKDYDQAIYCFNPKTKQTTTFKIGYDNNEFRPDYGVSTITEYGEDVIISTNNGELVALDGKEGLISWEFKWMREQGSPENQEYRLYVDKDGNFWCQVLDHTYIYMWKEKKWFGSLQEFFAAHGIEGIPNPLMVWNVVVDDNGWLWLVCDHEGLIVVDLKEKQWKQFKNNKYDETTISDNTLRNIKLMDDGSVWIGTYKNGVNQYVAGLSSLKNVELGDITTVCEDKHGNYWLGTNDQGILVYSPMSGEVVAHYTKENSGLNSNIVVGSWAASDGTIWFGSYNGGLTHCIPSATDPSHATILNTQASPGGLANNSVWDLTEDKWGRIWFSTLGGGLQMLDPKTHKFHTWDSKNSQVAGDYMTSVGWSKKGWLMVGTGHFYSLVNPVNFKLANQVIPESPNIPVNISSTAYVIEDSRGLIWHGSTSGLTVYDPKTKFITLLDMTSGLFGSSINSIIEDKSHNIWTVTDHGVTNIVPQKQEDGTWQFNIRSFNSRHGLQKSTYNQRSTRITHDGLLLIGGQGGLDIINPATLQDTKSKERPVFCGLQIFDQDVAVGKEFEGRVILDEALDVCRELILKFNDQFTIQLSTDNVVIDNHKRFAYMLEGFNKNWVKTSEQNPNITYNSLRAGSYILHVRILNEDGTLGNEESTMEIIIRPPLWRTRWMVLLYMVFIALVAYLFVKWYLKRHKEKAELEQLCREQDKRQWMSEMRTQLLKEMSAGQPSARLATEDVEVIHESEIADDAVPFSAGKPAPPKIELQKTIGNLVSFLQNVCEDYTGNKEKRIKLSFNSSFEEIDIPFDPQQMKTVLVTLLDNAVKFSLSGSKIQVTTLKPTPDRAAILVADNGAGIKDEYKKNLFEPFIVDGSIGLDVVKQIVEAHHGTISVADNPGGGTVFTISLPVEDPDIEEAVVIEDEE